MMKDSDDKMEPQIKLQIGFPKSDQDHRLQLVEINGSIFAILHAPLESDGPINLQCEEWSLVLLAPIRSKTDIEVSAINVICFNEIESEEGTVNIHASNRLVKFATSSKQLQKIHETAEHGKFQFDDDPGFFLSYFKLFNLVINKARAESLESLSEAQKNFIVSLCGLAEKIEGKAESLNIVKVLQIWDVNPIAPPK